MPPPWLRGQREPNQNHNGLTDTDLVLVLLLAFAGCWILYQTFGVWVLSKF